VSKEGRKKTGVRTNVSHASQPLAASRCVYRMEETEMEECQRMRVRLDGLDMMMIVVSQVL
jgi:hypothetical protein